MPDRAIGKCFFERVDLVLCNRRLIHLKCFEVGKGAQGTEIIDLRGGQIQTGEILECRKRRQIADGTIAEIKFLQFRQVSQRRYIADFRAAESQDSQGRASS